MKWEDCLWRQTVSIELAVKSFAEVNILKFSRVNSEAHDISSLRLCTVSKILNRTKKQEIRTRFIDDIS